MVSSATDKTGVEFVKPHLAHLANQISDAILEARNKMQPAWVVYGYGRCAMAKNRDFYDEQANAWACGFNPEGHADDTVLVARADKRRWQDSGNARELCLPSHYVSVGQSFALARLYRGDPRGPGTRIGAPALFLQGASGDLAPHENFVGDAAVADMQGRQPVMQRQLP